MIFERKKYLNELIAVIEKLHLVSMKTMLYGLVSYTIVPVSS